jgi:hypothetical protein
VSENEHVPCIECAHPFIVKGTCTKVPSPDMRGHRSSIKHGVVNVAADKDLLPRGFTNLLTRRASAPFAGSSRPQSGVWYADVCRWRPC